MRFTPAFIQSLKDSVSLIDVASENIELRKTGNRYMGKCPFHGDRSPSFSVNKDFYYCFGCKATGDVIKFVMELHGLSFEETCEDLAEKAKLPLPENENKLSSEEERAQYLRRQNVQKAARINHFLSLKYYHQNLLKNHDSLLFQEGRDYLKKRGISSKTIEQFQIGVGSAQIDGAAQFLTHAKAPLEIARQIQVIRPSTKTAGDYDFFRERLMFPLIDVRGRVCGFGGRILPSVDAVHRDQKLPKYLNSAESDLFQKSKFLYGLYQAKRAIREEEVVILVEGYFDTVALHQYGIENTVAPCGTSLTDDHLKTLGRLAKKVIVFFDQDEAGIGATLKSMELGLKHGLLLYGIQFESKLDPDEFLLADPVGNLAKLKEWIANAHPLLDFTIDRLFKESAQDLEKRTQAIKQATTWLSAYTDPVGRAVRVDQLIQKWKIPEAALGTLARPNASGVPTRAMASNSGSRDPRNSAQNGSPGAGSASAHPYAPRNSPPGMPRGQNTVQSSGADPRPGPHRRRGPVPLFDRELVQFLVKFSVYGASFLEARKQLPEKDTLSELFEDSEVQTWIVEMNEDPAGFSKLKLAPESLVKNSISQELRSVIMEGLLQETDPQDEIRLKALLKHGVFKAWARFSHKLKAQMAEADSRQDMEKFKELSEQFLDLQRKLKEFEDSYVSG